MREAAEDFRYSAFSEQEQRPPFAVIFAAVAPRATQPVSWLIFLGLSSPTVLDMAGYSDEAAQRLMEMLAGIEDEGVPHYDRGT